MSAPVVSLLIPYGFDDPRREEIFMWTLTRWRHHFPDWQACLAVDPYWQEMGGRDTYNRSRARNRAFQKADGDILVLADADTACNKENVEQAVYIARTTNAWVIAHRTYYSLNEETTDELLQKPADTPLTVKPLSYDWKMLNKSEAGVLVMPREAFEAVEGYDERFAGWGYEDNAFAETLKQKWGPPQRTPGDMFHLWHPRGEDTNDPATFEQPYIKENEALLERITAGQWSPDERFRNI